MLRLLLMFVIILFVIITFVYIHSKNISETFLEKSIPQQGASPIEELITTLSERVKILTVPVINATNSIIENVNDVSTKLWQNSIKSSTQIRSKLKQYAEGMTSYNRSPDDSESLKMVTINKRHKVFIDNMRRSNFAQFDAYSKVAQDFYGSSFEDQDIMLVTALAKLSKYHPDTTSLIEKKVKDL